MVYKKFKIDSESSRTQIVTDNELAKLYQVERSKQLPHIPFELWQQRALEIIQTVFSPMYRHVWESCWNNSEFAYARRSYYYCDFVDGTYEIYMPIALDGENIMHYWRIVIKVYKEIDREKMEKNQSALKTPYIRPVGVVDSETICHLAMTTTNELKQKLASLWKAGGRRAWFKGLLKGFRHEQKRGYFTMIVVQNSPDIAVKRLLSLLLKFLYKRITGFLKKLKLQPWMFMEHLQKRHANTLLTLIERYSSTIRNIMTSLLGTFDWLRMKLKDLYAEIGRQNIQKTKIKPLIHEIREIIAVFHQRNPLRNRDVPDPPIIQRLAAALQIR